MYIIIIQYLNRYTFFLQNSIMYVRAAGILESYLIVRFQSIDTLTFKFRSRRFGPADELHHRDSYAGGQNVRSSFLSYRYYLHTDE